MIIFAVYTANISPIPCHTHLGHKGGPTKKCTLRHTIRPKVRRALGLRYTGLRYTGPGYRESNPEYSCLIWRKSETTDFPNKIIFRKTFLICIDFPNKII